MKTTPKQDPNSSENPMSDFKDGLGNLIPMAAFENVAGPPGEPKSLSPENLKQFYERMDAVKAAAKAQPE